MPFAATDSPPDQAPRGPDTIMLVDDNPGNLRVLGGMLQQAGYRVRAALSGELALLSLRNDLPDLVLLDIRMPVMDGYEVCRYIKADPASRDVPVIFISALHDLEDKVRGFQSGGVDYIVKPFQLDEVLARVRTHLALVRARRELQALNASLEQRIAERTAELEASKARIEFLAFHDELTGLPNRRLLGERLAQELARARRRGETGAVLFIDLDHFKHINDALGHAIGDLYLREIAQRLRAALRSEDTLARWGGDEFLALLPGLSEECEEAAHRAHTVALHLAQALAQPALVEGHELLLDASIGIALYPNDGESGAQLLSNADLAMYQAKRAGRNTIRFFEQRMQVLAAERLGVEKELRGAIDRGELRLHYQVQIDAAGAVAGTEALVRWLHPVRGLLGPGEFIAIAEESGLIVPLGEWVLRAALRQQVAWSTDPATARSLRQVAVNVSPRQFQQPDFVEQVEAILGDTGADPRTLELEVTEGMLLVNVDDAIAKMSRLKGHGVRFAVDDFGTGYSSLAYLKRLPLDRLKIDRSFVQGVHDDPQDAAIVGTIIAMAQHLGLEVIAEGVETAEEWAFLRSAGCPNFQGYLFGRPLEVATLTEAMTSRKG